MIIGHYARGCSSMVEFQPSKLAVRVRFPSPAPHRGIAQLVEYWSPKPWVVGSSPSAPAIIDTQFRYRVANKRKTEISRDFSVFFVHLIFRKFVDIICPFQSTERTRTTEKAFFAENLYFPIYSFFCSRSKTVSVHKRLTFTCTQYRYLRFSKGHEPAKAVF